MEIHGRNFGIVTHSMIGAWDDIPWGTMERRWVKKRALPVSHSAGNLCKPRSVKQRSVRDWRRRRGGLRWLHFFFFFLLFFFTDRQPVASFSTFAGQVPFGRDDWLSAALQGDTDGVLFFTRPLGEAVAESRLEDCEFPRGLAGRSRK